METLFRGDKAVDAVKFLADNSDKLETERDRNFARSLIEQLEDKGSLSIAQWPWVIKLAEKIANKNEEVPEKRTPPIDLKGIVELLHTARKELKWPKINIRTESGQRVRLSVAGNKSRCPGAINVTDGGGFGSGKWFGRIDVDGDWHPGRDNINEVNKLLIRIGEDPAGAASVYGVATGVCCFCDRELSDKRSVSVGYGPICAAHWGLPWGVKEKEVQDG